MEMTSVMAGGQPEVVARLKHALRASGFNTIQQEGTVITASYPMLGELSPIRDLFTCTFRLETKGRECDVVVDDPIPPIVRRGSGAFHPLAIRLKKKLCEVLSRMAC